MSYSRAALQGEAMARAVLKRSDAHAFDDSQEAKDSMVLHVGYLCPEGGTLPPTIWTLHS